MEPQSPFARTLTGMAILVGLFVPILRLTAQSAAPVAPTFEVASVKPNKSGEPFVRLGLQPGGRFNAQNVPARELIRFAFNVQPFQLDGGPNWLNSDRFDITAKTPSDPAEAAAIGPGQMRPVQLMLQVLLADRFKLKAHRETKEVPVYNLVLARADGKLGPKIERSTIDCVALARGRAVAAGRGGAPPGPPQPPRVGERPECAMMAGLSSIVAGGVTIDEFARLLSGRVNRPVVNKTGLSGNYAFTLEFTPDQMPPPGAVPPGVPSPPINPDGPSIFTAIQEQLGLKLDSARGAVEMVVIDSVDQPTSD
jgi:bla regulator protein blaR1